MEVIKAKYDGIIHKVKFHGKMWRNDGLVEMCLTECDEAFEEMGTEFHGRERKCPICFNNEEKIYG